MRDGPNSRTELRRNRAKFPAPFSAGLREINPAHTLPGRKVSCTKPAPLTYWIGGRPHAADAGGVSPYLPCLHTARAAPSDQRPPSPARYGYEAVPGTPTRSCKTGWATGMLLLPPPLGLLHACSHGPWMHRPLDAPALILSTCCRSRRAADPANPLQRDDPCRHII